MGGAGVGRVEAEVEAEAEAEVVGDAVVEMVAEEDFKWEMLTLFIPKKLWERRERRVQWRGRGRRFKWTLRKEWLEHCIGEEEGEGDRVLEMTE
jgi:hypothetical protein